MSYNKEEIKITKKEKNDSKSLIKNIIYFSYKNIDYMYYKTIINEYKDYEVNIYILKDEWKGKPIYSEYGSENNDCELLIEINYSQMDDDFCNKLTNLQLISENYKNGQEKFYDKLDYYYDYFKNKENAPVIQTNRPKENYEHFFYDNRLKYFFKINGKSYRLIREIEKHENIKREIFIVNNLDKDFVKLDLMEQTKIDNNGVIVNFLCSDFGNDIENGIRVGGVDVDEYNRIVEVVNGHFHKHFEMK